MNINICILKVLVSSKVFLYFVKHKQKHTQFSRNKEKFNILPASNFPINFQAAKLEYSLTAGSGMVMFPTEYI